MPNSQPNPLSGRQVLPIGINVNAVTHDGKFESLNWRFRAAKRAEFDFVDRSPAPGEVELYEKASKEEGIAVLAGGGKYVVGRDEALLEWHFHVARALGATYHNAMILAKDAEGRLVSDERIAEVYLWASGIARRCGVVFSLENHVNMWSENPLRVARVARMVEARGGRFYLTLDPSHVLFKIGNDVELKLAGIDEEVKAGRCVLDPFCQGNVISAWIEAGWVSILHGRPAAPRNPPNILATHEDGSPGRGIQYPFNEPQPGKWHSPWKESDLDSWKEVIRQLLTYHARTEESPLGLISMEINASVDYGAGAKYSIFEDNVACARWIREEWNAIYSAVASPLA